MSENPFALVQIGMNSIWARQALIGWNRALNQTLIHLEDLPEGIFGPEDLAVIDRTYEMIPTFKRRLDLLSELLDQITARPERIDEYDLEAFVHDFKTIRESIESHMEILGKVLMRNR